MPETKDTNPLTQGIGFFPDLSVLDMNLKTCENMRRKRVVIIATRILNKCQGHGNLFGPYFSLPNARLFSIETFRPVSTM